MLKTPIQMVDVLGQYERFQSRIDAAVIATIRSGAMVGGPAVEAFRTAMSKYLDTKHVIPCGNGTDALQIALMALGLQRGDEVIVPAFTYVATAEVIGLLGLTPVMIDVEPNTFNINAALVEAAITPRTKAIIPVHLFGQSTDMEAILQLAEREGIYVVEDNAQAIGAEYRFTDGTVRKTGTIGHIGCTSFYPSKNLGAYGDGGALFTNDDALAETLRSTANHGQSCRRYYHERLGVNSRLDSIQAAILTIKLAHLDEFNAARNAAAGWYDEAFADMDEVQIPHRHERSTHVFHQYTLRVSNGKRDALKAHLNSMGIPSMIYYPVPLYRQEAYRGFWDGTPLPHTEALSHEVLSLPMHSELTLEICNLVSSAVQSFFRD